MNVRPRALAIGLVLGLFGCGGEVPEGATGGAPPPAPPGEGPARPPRPGVPTPTPPGGTPTPTPPPVTPPEAPTVWARGIQVGLVEVAQATFIKIGEGQTPVMMRNAPIIEGRPLVVRVHVVPGQGFTARPLRGVVVLNNGTPKRFEEMKMISGPSNTERLETTFNIQIPAAEVKPESGIWVGLYEAGAAMGAEPAPPPRFPAMGFTDLAVKAGTMVLDVVGVPVTGPSGALMDTPERRKKLEDHLFDIYPVQKVNLRIREAVQVAARVTERTAAFGLLRDARTADGASAKPYEYYHLLLAREDTSFTFAGTAGGGGGGANDPGARRVALTIVRGRSVDGNVDTVAHELGHNHGQGHVAACGATSNDGDFPYPNGGLGVNGWSLTENSLKSATRFKELMGYCRPRWVSDWMFGKFEARVRMVSALPRQPGLTALAEQSLQGFIGPGETPSWGVVMGRMVDGDPAMTTTRQAQLVLADGSTVPTAISVTPLSDGVTREVGVNLPLDVPTERAEIVVDGERFPVPVSALASP